MKAKQTETERAAHSAPEIITPDRVERADALPVHGRTQSAPRITRTKARDFTKELRRVLPEHELLSVHRELLHKRDREVVVVGQGIAREVRIIDHGPNVKAASAALAMGYKLHGRMLDAPPAGPNANVYNIFYKPQVQEALRSYEDMLKQSLKNEARGIEGPHDA